MYHFALVALMALAVVKVVDVLTDNVEALQRFRSLLTIAFGVGIVLWLDYSIFDGWNIAIDDRDTGLWLTGFMVAGMTVPGGRSSATSPMTGRPRTRPSGSTPP